MKRIFFVILLILAILSCSDEKNVVNIYTWDEFISQEVIEDFEKETGIKVNMSYYDTNDVMLSKMLSGKNDYDIISPSTDFVQILIQKNLLSKLDWDKLGDTRENLTKDIDLIEISKVYDENLEYTIPYMIFATGITVNKKYVKDYNKDLSIFENSEYKGRMTMLDDSSEIIRMTLQYLGYDSNSENMDELEEAKKQILKWKRNLSKFENLTYGNSLATGEVYVSHGYPDVYNVISEDEKDDFEYFLPKGAMMYIDSMAITKDSKNIENAYKFLEFIYRPENYIKILEEFQFISAIKGLNDKVENKRILSFQEINEKAKLPGMLNENAKKLHEKIWTEIKLEN